jgi:hypothetical protein
MGHPQQEIGRPCGLGALVDSLLEPSGRKAAAAGCKATTPTPKVSPMSPDQSVTHVSGCTVLPLNYTRRNAYLT